MKAGVEFKVYISAHCFILSTILPIWKYLKNPESWYFITGRMAFIGNTCCLHSPSSQTPLPVIVPAFAFGALPSPGVYSLILKFHLLIRVLSLPEQGGRCTSQINQMLPCKNFTLGRLTQGTSDSIWRYCSSLSTSQLPRASPCAFSEAWHLAFASVSYSILSSKILLLLLLSWKSELVTVFDQWTILTLIQCFVYKTRKKKISQKDSKEKIPSMKKLLLLYDG